MFEEIDAAARQLCGDELVKFQGHIGGGQYGSVTSGYKCVDFQTFYVPYGQLDVRPTKKGIALRLHEWANMRLHQRRLPHSGRGHPMLHADRPPGRVDSNLVSRVLSVPELNCA